jgi:uncharacterized membrane protein/mono/diheme cytochrome c family protein
MNFIGRFHPVLVHLPIGILLLACLFQWITRRDKFRNLEPAIGIALFWGMFFAIFSCITGFVLNQSGEYDSTLVQKHQWLGISVAVVSIVLYYLHKRSVNSGFARWISLLLALLITITGHLGGSLTHGEGYLTSGFTSDDTVAQRKAIPDVQAAFVYNDVVKPMLQQKCYSCHGPNKQKGKLRLDDSLFIMKGGKEGSTLVPGNPNESEMIRRILLARNEEHHMPPKEKPQLTENEIALLHWWVESGAQFNRQVKDLVQPEKIKPVLLALQQEDDLERADIPDIPAEEVEAADPAAIQKLKHRGAVVFPVAQNSNYLMVNFVTIDSATQQDLIDLALLKKQVIWLKLSGQAIADSGFALVAQCNNLMRLQIDHTNITDKGLASLKELRKLKYLNLVGTKVTAEGVLALRENKNLQSIYLYQTAVLGTDWPRLRQAFPNALLDSGGYKVPTLESDTTEVREQKKK